MTDKQQTFQSVLNYPRQLFAFYRQQINQQCSLLAQIKTVLPAELAEHALYCVLKETKIRLYTDAAVWSSQLRFYQQAIIEKLHQLGHRQVEKLQIKVMANIDTNSRANKPTVPCLETVEVVRRAADEQQDRDLQRALSGLAATLDRLANKQS